MIAHIVLFRLTPGLSDDARDGLAEALSAAAARIPAIRHARVGSRVTVGRPYEQLMATDYPFAAILEFDDVAALYAYLDHPLHEQLAQRFYECIEQALTYDFDLQAPADGIQQIRGRLK